MRKTIRYKNGEFFLIPEISVTYWLIILLMMLKLSFHEL